MDNKINVYNVNGELEEIEILDIFTVEGYDKEYVLYTKNVEVDADNIEAYVSILQKNSEDSYSLVNIVDEKEWELVQKTVNEVGDSDE